MASRKERKTSLHGKMSNKIEELPLSINMHRTNFSTGVIASTRGHFDNWYGLLIGDTVRYQIRSSLFSSRFVD
jgi:hypothetical protein